MCFQVRYYVIGANIDKFMNWKDYKLIYLVTVSIWQ